CFGRVTLFNVSRDGGAFITLAHFRAVSIQNEWNMRVVRWLNAECAENFNMFGRVGKMVLAADHVGNFHLEVVDDVYEMKNPRAVRPPDRHIGMRARIGQIEIDFTADEIVHDDVLPWRT